MFNSYSPSTFKKKINEAPTNSAHGNYFEERNNQRMRINNALCDLLEETKTEESLKWSKLLEGSVFTFSKAVINDHYYRCIEQLIKNIKQSKKDVLLNSMENENILSKELLNNLPKRMPYPVTIVKTVEDEMDKELLKNKINTSIKQEGIVQSK